MMMTRRPEQAEADGEHAGDAAGAEGDGERVGHAVGQRGGSRSDVAAGGERHADVAGESRRHAAEDEGDGAPRPGLPVGQCRRLVGLDDLGGREEHDERQRDEDHGDRLELPLQVRPGAFLDGDGDLLHLRCAFGRGEHQAHEIEADTDGQQRRRHRQPQDGPLAALEHEVLPAAFGSEQRKIHVLSRFRTQPRCHAQRAHQGRRRQYRRHLPTRHPSSVAALASRLHARTPGGTTHSTAASSSGLRSSSSRWAVSGYQRRTMITTRTWALASRAITDAVRPVAVEQRPHHQQPADAADQGRAR